MTSHYYAINTTDLRILLLAIKEKGVPSEVDNTYLVKIGMTKTKDGKASNNAKNARKVLRGMNFIDADNKPTTLWSKDGRTNFVKSMSQGLKNLYPDENGVLQYETASKEDLTNFFHAGSGFSPDTVGMCVRTFTLIQRAANGEDISSSTTPIKKANSNSKQQTKTAEKKSNEKSSPAGDSDGIPTPQMAINIQLQVPSDPTGDVYEKFFEAMKKHLFTNG